MCVPTDPTKKCMIAFKVQQKSVTHSYGTESITHEYVADEEKYVIGRDAKKKRSHVEVDCNCAMTDSVQGFCASVIGTKFYAESVAAQLKVLKKSM